MQGGWDKAAFFPSLERDTHQPRFCENEDDGFREGLNPSHGLSQLAHLNVDVDINYGHALLRRLVRAAFIPTAFARTGISDIGQSQASPLRKRA